MSYLRWRRMHSYFLAVLAIWAVSALALGPTGAAQSYAAEGDVAGIRAAAERFLRALDDLDWEPFQASWVSEPTVFFPFGDTPDRVTGHAAVEARWRRFFEDARRRGTGPPYLHLKPRDLRVERYGDVWLVTFMFEGLPELQGQVARRTLLLIREHDMWKVAHLHASAVGQR